MQYDYKPHIYSIGHSNHTIEALTELLRQHGISAVVDTRSTPHSAYAPQFNREPLSRKLAEADMRYVFMGDSLGGKPQEEFLYDQKGHASYSRIASTEEFRRSIERLVRGAALERIALLCGEEDPKDCHRRLLVGRGLVEKGVETLHIRGDGSVTPESAMRLAIAESKPQMRLIPEDPEQEWTSTRSVLPRRAPRSSSSSYVAEESAGY